MDITSEEIWKDVVGFEEYYSVSSHGRVVSKERLYRNSSGRLITKHSKELKPFGETYLRVGLKRPEDEKVYKLFLHRVVASAFIENTDNKPTVNHKDGNKQNCFAYNLEWATYEEQIEHAVINGLMDVEAISESIRQANSKPVLAYNLVENKLYEFSSITEATEELCMNKGVINWRIANDYCDGVWRFEFKV